MDDHQLDWIDIALKRPAPSTSPASPGHRGIDTSVKAAEALAPRLPSLQKIVRAVIAAAGTWGATGDEVAAKLGWERYSVRPRTAELRKTGMIRDSGRRRTNTSGRAAIVWVVD